MKKFLLLILLSTGTIAFSQNDEAFVDSQVSQFIAQLGEQSQPVFSRKNYCEGKIEMFKMPDGKMCSSKSTYYSVFVFWNENEKNNVKKFDNCGAFETVALEDDDLIQRVSKIKKELQKEEVKSYKAENQDKTPFGNMNVEDCRKEYSFNFGSENFKKSFKEFDLGNDSNSPNVNAHSNNSLSLVVLDKELATVISGLEGEGKFRRINN